MLTRAHSTDSPRSQPCLNRATVSTAYGLDRGYLVYAKDSGTEPPTHVVRNSDPGIVVRALDVELEPDDLLRQVERLADEVAGVVMRAGPEVAAATFNAN